jgi:hypothetical protein
MAAEVIPNTAQHAALTPAHRNAFIAACPLVLTAPIAPGCFRHRLAAGSAGKSALFISGDPVAVTPAYRQRQADFEGFDFQAMEMVSPDRWGAGSGLLSRV